MGGGRVEENLRCKGGRNDGGRKDECDVVRRRISRKGEQKINVDSLGEVKEGKQ